MKGAINLPESIIPMELGEAMAKSFIDYAMSVITDRALPDVRDGLKPVHRRILYTMYTSGFTPDKPYRKSVATVGECLKSFHPHGDAAVYDSIVTLAQAFTMRYQLVDGHGNFGSIDGDSAAAMRYTEARLHRHGYSMLTDIEKDTVDFMPNFDASDTEPRVLPTLFPNLLANGTTGIAVGMATNMAPHNVGELYDAIEYIINCTLDGKEPDENEIIKIVKAPDFPTGAQIIGLSGAREAFLTGRGRIVIRSKYSVEERAGRTNIVITELPFRVNKARLVEKIDALKKTEIPGIKEVRDESDKDGISVVIELKKDTNAQLVINKLLKHTEMQSSFCVNNTVLVDGQPRTVSLKEALEHFLSHVGQVIYVGPNII
jgi:DNA gyrase subunit A